MKGKNYWQVCSYSPSTTLRIGLGVYSDYTKALGRAYCFLDEVVDDGNYSNRYFSPPYFLEGGEDVGVHAFYDEKDHGKDKEADYYVYLLVTHDDEIDI